MNEKIIMVSEKRDNFYDLTELIHEFMKVEGKTEMFAINYFMTGLEGSRYKKFPINTPTMVITEWILT